MIRLRASGISATGPFPSPAGSLPWPTAAPPWLRQDLLTELTPCSSYCYTTSTTCLCTVPFDVAQRTRHAARRARQLPRRSVRKPNRPEQLLRRQRSCQFNFTVRFLLAQTRPSCPARRDGLGGLESALCDRICAPSSGLVTLLGYSFLLSLPTLSSSCSNSSTLFLSLFSPFTSPHSHRSIPLTGTAPAVRAHDRLAVRFRDAPTLPPRLRPVRARGRNLPRRIRSPRRSSHGRRAHLADAPEQQRQCVQRAVDGEVP